MTCILRKKNLEKNKPENTFQTINTLDNAEN